MLQLCFQVYKNVNYKNLLQFSNHITLLILRNYLNEMTLIFEYFNNLINLDLHNCNIKDNDLNYLSINIINLTL